MGEAGDAAASAAPSSGGLRAKDDEGVGEPERKRKGLGSEGPGDLEDTDVKVGELFEERGAQV